MQFPSIVIFGLRLNEPITSLTDFLIFIFCIILSILLFKNKIFLWSFFYFFLSVSALFGALGHGFYAYKDNILMLFSRVLMILSTFFASISSIFLLKNHALKIFLIIFSIFTLLATLYFIAQKNSFYINKWNTGIGISTILIIHFIYSLKLIKGSKLIFAGFLIIAFAGILHSLHVSIENLISENDVAHFFSIIALILICKGILILNKYDQKRTEN